MRIGFRGVNYSAGVSGGTSAPSSTHYDTLGISRTATPEEVKAAYRQLARKHHPDVHNESDANRKAAEQKFTGIAAAYEILSDPTKRTTYDKELADKTKLNSAGASPQSTPPEPKVNVAWNNAWAKAGKFNGAIEQSLAAQLIMVSDALENSRGFSAEIQHISDQKDALVSKALPQLRESFERSRGIMDLEERFNLLTGIHAAGNAYIRRSYAVYRFDSALADDAKSAIEHLPATGELKTRVAAWIQKNPGSFW